MPKMSLTCDWCGKQYESYQRGKYHTFCSIEHRRLAGKMVAESFTPEFREMKSRQFSEMNKTLMREPVYIEKRRLSLREKNKNPNGYVKLYGRHEHRVVAEEMIGRKLRPDEVVHHIDGNKSNNDPSNLMVMTQSEHIKLHLRQGGGRLC